MSPGSSTPIMPQCGEDLAELTDQRDLYNAVKSDECVAKVGRLTSPEVQQLW